MARVEITYCPKCRWLPRAAWLAEELLFTFERGLSVTLRPGEAGEMRVLLDGQILFDRAVEGRFPEPKELKQAIRDRVEPSRDLGHSDG
ncbi:MAG: SelT/SelW/SelH family protein [Sandaracinaceae bacterium]|nr:MAG: SelT/SelW/SelH family protein [Sandaracinaceae bacterium]HBQ11228.1 SelT/selW/selH domain protein [Myxococcales bacterium]